MISSDKDTGFNYKNEKKRKKIQQFNVKNRSPEVLRIAGIAPRIA